MPISKALNAVVSATESQLWSVQPVSVLRDLIAEWSGVCDGCAGEAQRAMDMAQQLGALRVVIVICGAESEGGDDEMEAAVTASARGEPSCVCCVDGDQIVVLPDDAAIKRFVEWCRENVTW